MKRTRTIRKPTSVPAKVPITELPEVEKQFRGVIYTRKKIDVEKEWTEIREWLSNNPKTVQDMREAVRQSADMAARAKDLYDLTKIHYDRFRIQYRQHIQLWRREAIAWWEYVKENQKIRKQITEQMIEDQMIEEHAEEYATLQDRMNEMETLKSSFHSLTETVISKGVDNRKLLESEMRRPGGSPNWFDGSNG